MKNVNKKKVIIPIILILLTAFLVINHFISNSKLKDMISATGNLEFREIELSSEVAGKVDKLLIEEGDNVKSGQLLAIVNSDILKAQFDQANANLLASKAKLSSLETGARKQEINQANESVSQAQANLNGAKQTLKNAQDIYDNRSNTKQVLDNAETQYKVAKTQYQNAKFSMEQIKSSLKNAEDNFYRIKNLYESASISKQQLDATKTQYDVLSNQFNSSKALIKQAEVSMIGAEQNFKNVKSIYDNRLQQKQQIDSSQTQLKIAETNYQIMKQRLDLLLDGAKKEDIDTLKANVKQAQASLQQAKIQLSRSKIYSPINGIVLVKNIEQGESVLVGSLISTIADIGKIWVKVYIPETQIGYIKLGQKANIKVDSFPDKVFTGIVKEISSKAEFTPRNVQTKEERVNQVFAVKIFIENKEGLLKSGMPSDVEIPLK